MNRRLFIGLTAIIIAVLAISNFYSRKELAGVKAALERLEAEQLESEQEKEDLLARLRDAQNRPEETVVYAAPPVETVIEEPPAEAVELEENVSRRMMRNISKMMENPAMNKMMAASQRGALDVMYSDLAEQFQLNEEEKQYFMDLLLVRQMNIVETSMKNMSGTLSKEEQAAISAELKEKNKQFRQELKYFLNNQDDFKEWKFYEKTIQDRVMLSQVEKDLEESGAPISDQTYRELLEAIHDEKNSFKFSSDFGDSQNMNMNAERFTEENINSYAADLKALNERIAERARTILTPEQFEIFMISQNASMEMQISQLEMAKRMFGGKQ